MGRAIFLATTIQGIRKATFRRQLLALINNQYQVVVLLAMTDFDEIWQAKREFSKIDLPKGTPSVRLISLADIYAEHDGVSLKAADFMDPDLSGLQTFKAHQGKLPVTRYIDADGNIVAETLFTEDNTRIHTLYFDKSSRISQINSYDDADRLFGIEKYVDDALTESLLLNAKGELVYRFTNYVKDQKVSYNVTPSSTIAAPQELSEIQDDKSNSKDEMLTAYEGQGKSTFTKALSYSDYHRYDDINAFYHQVLLNMNIEDARTYIDIDNIVDASKYLPGKRIFNY
ncbi:hypothetical protein ACN50G_11355 [Lentilactobacillus buchneri]|uniref:Uncharacterized protein n=1 Tax=Lentilactobacillus buchneri DSM 20057 TaxID=1423728 RepID=A0A4R5NL18_LENBU|nr:hypothetical protein [Lentilactobacillus buchneri]AEB73887.1 hypothetical protein Lbuc_1639 [Lentilactobacillus buchneri NRRL B-30929]KRK66526.1 hypothetical protein FC79_GL001973 [Lentilactobacillus buchneri DSM 20057]MCT2882976.1 hypothetical protein [Lentilactobacillus buchneri]MCT2899271.1 hypothetical protein [Lentilactobacillus buchneri]MCT3253840.1 hypothetical protein [Lentilactobacillus buchneri]